MRVLRRFSLLSVVLLCLAAVIALPAMNAHAQGGTTYTVQSGDNLFRISLRCGTTVAALAQANGISNPALIFVGQVLTVPGSCATGSSGGGQTGGGVTATPAPGGSTGGGTVGSYTVQSGDTLSAIAGRFGTTVAAIAQANNIVNVNLIFPGEVLKIAGAPVTQPSSGGSSGGNVPPPGPLTGGFELGGQVQNFSSNTQSVMKSAHMKWVKFQLANGDGNGPNLVAAAHGTGFKVLLSVVGDKGSITNAGYQQGFAQYVASLARAGADAIEVWNEENLDREWPTGQINPTTYVSLLSQSYNAIKGANSATLVISGAPSPTGAESAFGLGSVWNDDHYYAGMAAAGAANFADCIGVHYNEGIVSPNQTSGDPRDNYPTRYFPTMLNRALASFPGKQACFTELGYVSPEGYGQLPAGFAWGQNTTAAQQAQWLGEAAARAGGSGRVRLMIVFNVDFTEFTSDPQAGYAIIRPGGGCQACATLASVVP